MKRIREHPPVSRLGGGVALGALLVIALAAPAVAQPCKADPRWVTQPSQPDYVNDPKTLCGFYQDGWQLFLYLMSPQHGANGGLTFESLPSLADTVGAVAAHLTAAAISTQTQYKDPHTGRTRVFEVRGSEPIDDFHQAGSRGVLVDQNGNVTYYEQFLNPVAKNFVQACSLSIAKCETAPAWQPLRFPSGSFEIKASYRVLPPGTPGAKTYYTLRGVQVYNPFTKQPQTVDLGLVGFHLVFATAHHPELIWITFEHIDNMPAGACKPGQKTTPPPGFPGWAFNNVNVTDCSKINVYPVDPMTQKPYVVPPAGYRTQGYLNWPFGSDPADDGPSNPNTLTLRTLNTSVLGILPPSSVWRSYYMGGGIWTDGGVLPADPKNEVGGLFIANSSLETFTQTANPGGGQLPKETVNCFSCHNPPNPSGKPPYTVSHAVGFDKQAACPATLSPACKATQGAPPH